MQFHMIEAIIHELPFQIQEQGTIYLGQQPTERVESFFSCLRCLRQYVDLSLSLTPDSFFSAPMIHHLFFTRCLHTTYRLSLFEDPAWDRHTVYRTIDLIDLLSRKEAMFRSIPTAVGLKTSGKDLYNRAGDVLKPTIAVWRKNLEEAGAIPTSTEEGFTESLEEPLGGMALDPTVYDPMSSNWLMDMFYYNNDGT